MQKHKGTWLCWKNPAIETPSQAVCHDLSWLSDLLLPLSLPHNKSAIQFEGELQFPLFTSALAL